MYQQPPPYTRRVFPSRISTNGTAFPDDPYDPRTTRSPRTSNERVNGTPTTLAEEFKTDRYGNVVSSNVPYPPLRESRRLSDTPHGAPKRRSSISAQPTKFHDYLPRRPPTGSVDPRHSADLVSSGDPYARGYYPPPAGSATTRHDGHRHSSSIEDPYRTSRGGLNDDRYREERGIGRRQSVEPGISRASTFDTAPRQERRGYPGRSNLREAANYDDDVPHSAHPDLGSRYHQRRASMEGTSSDGRSSFSRDQAPPVTRRGLDRVNDVTSRNDGLARNSIRPGSREGSRTRRDPYEDSDYYIAPRRTRRASDQQEHDRPYITSPVKQNFDEPRISPRQSARRFQDDIVSRGFGVRQPSEDPPRDRRGSVDKLQVVPAGTIPEHLRLANNAYEHEPSPRDTRKAPAYALDDEEEDRPREKPDVRRRDRAPAHESRSGAEDPDYAALLERESHAVQEHPTRSLHHRSADSRGERGSDSRDYEDDEAKKRPRDHGGFAQAALPAAAAGVAAAAAGAYARRHKKDDEVEQPRRKNRDEDEEPPPRRRNRDDDENEKSRRKHHDEDEGNENIKPRRRNREESEEEESPPRRNSRAIKEAVKDPAPDKREVPAASDANEDDELVREAQSNYKPPSLEQAPAEAVDEDAEYQRILQQELRRSSQSKPDAHHRSDENKRDVKDDNKREIKEEDDTSKALAKTNGSSNDREDEGSPQPTLSKALQRYTPKDEDNYDEAVEDDSGAQTGPRNSRVRIVEPPKEGDKPKGILRRPTVKFPDYPEGPKEAIAPLKPVEGAPPEARWVKISRSLVSPRALEEAGERFEETRDHVIVLRVLSQDQIKKYAERSKEIREGKESKDKHDRDSRRRKDDDEDDDDDDLSDENRHRRRHRRHRRHHDDDDEKGDGK